MAAAAAATAVTGAVSVVGLIGPHLPAGLALRFAASTSGFAAMKFLLVGPLVAVAAAIAYRVGPKAATDDAPPPSAAAPQARTAVATVAVTVVLAAIVSGAAWWRGGPTGYAFPGLLVAPVAAAGIVGYLAGVAIFVAVFAALVRPALHRITTPSAAAASVWLAAVAAGACLGTLDAVVAALPPADHLPSTGPDSWWIGST